MRCSDGGEKPKNAPQIFPGFRIIKSARHCGKITIFGHNVHTDEHGFRSGGMFLSLVFFLDNYRLFPVKINIYHHLPWASQLAVLDCRRFIFTSIWVHEYNSILYIYISHSHLIIKHGKLEYSPFRSMIFPLKSLGLSSGPRTTIRRGSVCSFSAPDDLRFSSYRPTSSVTWRATKPGWARTFDI